MKSEQQQLEELKIAIDKVHNRPITNEEARQAYHLLKLLTESAVKHIFTEADLQTKLKDNPKGFHLEERGSCGVCGKPAVKENSWYDKNGVKCIPCQKALDKKVIPLFVIKNKESWYSNHDLEIYFNIDRYSLKKYVKQGLLKKRTIALNEKQVHLELFLISDNKDVLPKKKLLPSKLIQVEKNGDVFYTHAQWYEHMTEKDLKKLQKYKIGEILKETFLRPIKQGSFYWKTINPLLTFK